MFSLSLSNCSAVVDHFPTNPCRNLQYILSINNVLAAIDDIHTLAYIPTVARCHLTITLQPLITLILYFCINGDPAAIWRSLLLTFQCTIRCCSYYWQQWCHWLFLLLLLAYLQYSTSLASSEAFSSCRLTYYGATLYDCSYLPSLPKKRNR